MDQYFDRSIMGSRKNGGRAPCTINPSQHSSQLCLTSANTTLLSMLSRIYLPHILRPRNGVGSEKYAIDRAKAPFCGTWSSLIFDIKNSHYVPVVFYLAATPRVHTYIHTHAHTQRDISAFLYDYIPAALIRFTTPSGAT